VTQVVENLPNRQEARGCNPKYHQKKKKKRWLGHSSPIGYGGELGLSCALFPLWCLWSCYDTDRSSSLSMAPPSWTLQPPTCEPNKLLLLINYPVWGILL
jgi:hypothetical protein